MAASYRLTNYIWSRQTHNSYNYCDTVHIFATVCNHCVNRKAFIYGRIVYNKKKQRKQKENKTEKREKKSRKTQVYGVIVQIFSMIVINTMLFN